MKNEARELLKVARELVAKSGLDRIVEIFDSLESRWEDESEYEDFGDYIKQAKKVVEREGFQFVNLNSRPMRLKFKDGTSSYSVFVKGNQIMLETEG